MSWRLPFFVCGVFMVLALAVASRKLREPAHRQAPVRVGQIFATYRRPAFVTLCVVTAAYNFVFFVVLGYTPLFLGLDIVPLGLAFTGWGLGLALPFWVGFAVLAVGVLVYLAFAHLMAAGYGERVLWSRWNRAARQSEHAPRGAGRRGVLTSPDVGPPRLSVVSSRLSTPRRTSSRRGCRSSGPGPRGGDPARRLCGCRVTWRGARARRRCARPRATCPGRAARRSPARWRTRT
ncbi:hypothetical protein ABZ807_14705 [Micromonospora sp. NPDC047548]|uniref:hypothetical protein n=1 Tax=Micromonospora sp. NPDC047548 TaxID=3155624 RepID=UPI0033FD1BD7